MKNLIRKYDGNAIGFIPEVENGIWEAYVILPEEH